MLLLEKEFHVTVATVKEHSLNTTDIVPIHVLVILT